MAIGYRRILLSEIDCVRCGTWRGAIEQEADFYPCPQCDTPSKMNFRVEGFTRRALPAWDQWAKPLSVRTREEISADDSGSMVAAIKRAQRSRQRIRKSEWISRRAVAP